MVPCWIEGLGSSRGVLEGVAGSSTEGVAGSSRGGYYTLQQPQGVAGSSSCMTGLRRRGKGPASSLAVRSQKAALASVSHAPTRWLAPLISLSLEEKAGFAREQWRSTWSVLGLSGAIMSLPNCYNVSLSVTTIVSLACGCSAMVAIRYLLSRMKDQERAACVFRSTSFYICTVGVIPIMVYETGFSYLTASCVAPSHEGDRLDEEVAGALGSFGYALFWVLIGNPWHQRVVVIVVTSCLMIHEWAHKGCTGLPHRLFLIANASAMVLGLTVGLSIECMQRISYLRKVQAVEKAETILTQSPTPLIALDLQGRITHLNAHSTRLLGAGLDKLAGIQMSSIAAPPFRKRAGEAVEMAKSGSSTQIVELTLVRLDPCGSTDRESADAAADAESSVRAAAGGGERGSDNVEVLMSTVPELDDDGLVCGIVCFLQDCTEIKRLQQEATQHAMEQVRLRAIEENLAVTFHELRNPLNGCVGFQRLAMESLEHALRLSDGGDRASPQLQSTRTDLEQALLCADHVRSQGSNRRPRASRDAECGGRMRSGPAIGLTLCRPSASCRPWRRHTGSSAWEWARRAQRSSV